MIRKHKKRLFFITAFTTIFLHFSCKVIFAMESQQKSGNKKIVIFDIGGVLAETNKSAALNVLGKSALTQYALRDWKTPHSLMPATYDCLHKLYEEKNDAICDPYGNSMPQFFCEVLKGTINENTACKSAHQAINEHQNFCSHRQKELCKTMATLMFHPKTLVETQQEISAGTQFLAECQRAGHTIFIFSNYAPEAFAQLKEKLPHVFDTIPNDNIVVSGHIGAAKPEPAAYEALKNRLELSGISPSYETCFFIDDQSENIAAAEEHGIRGIHCVKRNFSAIRRQFKEYGIL